MNVHVEVSVAVKLSVEIEQCLSILKEQAHFGENVLRRGCGEKGRVGCVKVSTCIIIDV